MSDTEPRLRAWLPLTCGKSFGGKADLDHITGRVGPSWVTVDPMRHVVIGLVVLATVLAGCGDEDADVGATPVAGDSASTTSGADDGEDGADDPSDDETSGSDDELGAGSVCDLATNEEISAIVGNEVLAVEIDATLCEYSLVEGVPASDGTTVDVFMNAASEESCELEFDLVGAGNGEPVDGVGNTAYWSAGSVTPQLFVCTGSWFVTITQYTPSTVSDDDALARAREVSDVILRRL